MKLKKFNTEYHKSGAAKVGELTIGSEVLSVYEITIKAKYDHYTETHYWLDNLKPEQEEDFLNVAQKLWDDIQKA